ncbi:hypothetical protein [Flavobacterium sp.]|uniref:hypothetical protein n=1 Tax=Flavobacterium sp. TaxID=239 RepID=UPI002C9CCD18|nr:hypothetical protein [Flavobacterium sp.]HSD07903.1 hypothetical protein [Flavobacterium sp.]
MIQTNAPIQYWRRSNDTDVVKIEVRPDEVTPEGQWFLVIDWLMSNTKDAFFSKRVFLTNEKIDQTETYIEANYDLSGLTRIEREKRKLQIALMLDTQTNLLSDGKTIYEREPSDWEYTEDYIARQLQLEQENQENLSE